MGYQKIVWKGSFMRALFILHESIFIYGANRSISGLLEKINFDYDIMICKSFTRKIDEDELRKRFGKHLQKIYAVWLPRCRCYQYDKIDMISECSHIVNNLMAFLDGKRRKKIISSGNYDYVHLNSLALVPVIDDVGKYIMHVREIANPVYKKIEKLARALDAAEGIIYIDEVTQTALGQITHNTNSIVLNNPFDMTSVARVNYADSLQKYGLSEANTVFSMLGQVAEVKGSKLVLRAFMKHANADSRLLIVGNYEHPYGRECKRMAEQDERIIFCGELKDTADIYRISDYIVRGESQFCIGRTIYEGLFSGTGVIMPGSEDNLDQMVNSQEYKNKIYLYQPQSKEGLIKVFDMCSHHKQSDKVFKSNVDDYMREYYSFINK